MKVRVIYQPDKQFTILHPQIKSKRVWETEEQWLKRVFDKAMLPNFNDAGQQLNPIYGCEYDDIEASELPPRSEKLGWEGEGKGIGIKTNQIKLAKALKDMASAPLITEEMKKIAKEKLIKDGKITE